ncbi:DEAD (Asp-Glu-Ala-Asp) box polypeptide 59 [Linnemannia zychae]|nr:DEAD (Asp-Glu-Ala-Asp) box polypeptide 59 [Linnemannia zychae]
MATGQLQESAVHTDNSGTSNKNTLDAIQPEQAAQELQVSSDKNIGLTQFANIHAPLVFYTTTRIIASVTGYREAPRTASLSALDVKNILETHKISVEGKHPPKPILSFEECGLPSKMLSNLIFKGFTDPRSIQVQTIPAGLAARDMVISAETGSGKTAGYLIPILTHAYGLSQSSSNAMRGPFVLVLAPTRELAMQIEQVTKDIVQGMPNMRTALLIGGQAMANQVHRLSQNIQVVIATPGRLIEIFIKHKEITFSNIFCLVLDEVDVMLNLGFRKQIKKILSILPDPPNGRQSIVCSATISKQIQQLIEKNMENPLRIRVGNVREWKKNLHQTANIDDIFSPSSKIKQTILWVENDSKKKELFSLLKDSKYFRPPVLIFVESRTGADLLAEAIQIKCPGITAASVHGEKTLEERTTILKAVMNGTLSVVVATGLLARGLDLHVATVINFDMAPSIVEYIHRVGRADSEVATKVAARIRKGPRLGGMAWAITFINNDHQTILSDFVKMLNGLGTDQVTPLPAQLRQYIVQGTHRSLTGPYPQHKRGHTLDSKMSPMLKKVKRKKTDN